MKQTVNINRLKHPYSTNIDASILTVTKIFNFILIITDCIGTILAIIAASAVSELAEHNADIPVNVFGYEIEFESEFFAASPLMVFIYIVIIFMFISLAITVIKIFVITSLEAKANALDCAYRTQKMTELMVKTNCKAPSETEEAEEIDED